MWLRTFQIFTLIFWLGSMGWLASVIWAPLGTRMKPVEAREAYNAFFQWNESTNMTLLDNGVRRGQITVAGYSGFDERAERNLNGISVSGLIESETEIGVSGMVDLFWRGVIDFIEEEDMKMHGGDFSIRIPNRQLSAHVAFEGDPMIMKAQALLNKIPIFSYNSADGKAPPAIPKSAASLLPIAGMGDPAEMNQDQFKPEITAQRGLYKLSGRELPVYLLTLDFVGIGQKLRVFLSEAGEPLLIETDLGYEAISEMLVPLEVYKNNGSTRKNGNTKSE